MKNTESQKVSLGLLNTGDILRSRYRILRSLGSEDFARRNLLSDSDTYLAEDLDRDNERCVLREFAPQLREISTLEKARELFEREAGVFYRLQHPQVPQFRELFCYKKQDESRLFLLKSYIAGQTYRTLLDRRIKSNTRFDEEEILKLLNDILSILEYIHSMGVIHRNISPNHLILRSQDNRAVLIDFGCIKEIENKAQLELNGALPSILRAIDTSYAPPEQVERGVVYAHSDLYALAATAVVLLTGKEPQQLIDFGSYRWYWRSAVTINPKLEWILTTMLSPYPRNRFGSAAEVKQILQDISVEETVPVVKPKPKLKSFYSAINKLF